jgi:hypothetical protein
MELRASPVYLSPCGKSTVTLLPSSPASGICRGHTLPVFLHPVLLCIIVLVTTSRCPQLSHVAVMITFTPPWVSNCIMFLLFCM